MEFLTSISSETWTMIGTIAGVGSFIIAIISLFVANRPKYTKTDEYKMYMNAVQLSDEELAIMVLNKNKRQERLKQFSPEKQQQLGRDYEFYKKVQTLKKRNRGERYFAVLKGLNLGIIGFLQDKPKRFNNKPILAWLFGANTFTRKSYQFCLLLAIIYPLLFAMVGMIFSGDLVFAQVQLTERANWLMRLTVVGLIVAGILFFYGKKVGRKVIENMGWLLCFISFIVLFTLDDSAVVIGIGIGIGIVAACVVYVADTAGAVTVLGAIVVAISFAVAVASAVDSADIVAVVGAWFILLIILVQKYYKWVICNLVRVSLFSFISVFALVVIALVNGDKTEQELLLISVFLGILPFTNAVIDWLSFAVTRGLLFKLAGGCHKPWQRWFYIGFDIVMVMVFVLLVTATSVVVLGGINSLATFFGGSALLDFNQLMADVKDPAKFGQTWWLHAMLFSTALPTLVHLLFALFALLLRTGCKDIDDKIANMYPPSVEIRQWFYWYNRRVWFKTSLLFVLVATAIFVAIYNFQFGTCLVWGWADMLLDVVDTGYNSGSCLWYGG